MDCYVYVYKDAAGVVRYVGKGCGNRAASHIALALALNEGRRKERASRFTWWLAKCLRNGVAFSYDLVKTALTDDQAFELEKRLISEHKRLREGGTLYNTLSGGDGFTRADAKFLSNQPETRKRKSDAVRAALAKPEVRERLRAASKEANGRPHRREQAREKALAEWKLPERRSAASKRAKELWADPAWAEKRRAELVARNKRKSAQ